jgi:Cns1/TTC4 Wheel domain
METRTGGLIKLGKNIPIGKVLSGGLVEVVDGLVTVFVVPRSKAEAWVEEFRESKKGRK